VITHVSLSQAQVSVNILLLGKLMLRTEMTVWVTKKHPSSDATPMPLLSYMQQDTWAQHASKQVSGCSHCHLYCTGYVGSASKILRHSFATFWHVLILHCSTNFSLYGHTSSLNTKQHILNGIGDSLDNNTTSFYALIRMNKIYWYLKLSNGVVT